MFTQESVDNLCVKLESLEISKDSLEISKETLEIFKEIVNNDSNNKLIKKKDFSHVLYYTLKLNSKDILDILTSNNIKYYTETDDSEIFQPFINDISKIKANDNFVIYNECIYLLNNDFHITLLYVGGRKESKPDENKKTNFDKCIELENFLHSNVQITLEKISISKKFITIRVLSCGDIPYFGNPIMHITIGLKISEEKLKPADSPSAFDDVDRTDISIKGITLNGIIDVVTK